MTDTNVRPRRVCFVVNELLGLVKNGGIGTATTHLALALAGHGEEVEIWVWGRDDKACSPEWSQRYNDAGVTVRIIEWKAAARGNFSPSFLRGSYTIYQLLKPHAFDVVVFQDWEGLGFCSMRAKSLGLAFSNCRLAVFCHGPTEWLREANRQVRLTRSDLGLAFIERRSAELCDTIVSPSRHLVDWMLGAGWALPADRRIIPYITAGFLSEPKAESGGLTGSDEHSVDEIVFFGRLEERKGVLTFTDALNHVRPELLAGKSVTFLGRPATFSTSEVENLLNSSVRSTLRELRFLTSLDQLEARAYLSQPGRLAVMPSHLDNSPNTVYECLEDGVPFLASSAGGTEELVVADDRPSVLFAPRRAELVGALERVLSIDGPPVRARPAFSGDRSLADWGAVLRPLASSNAELPQPLVSVVIPHFNQGHLLRYAIDSIMRQDYPNLEVIVVDDGSTDDDAARSLDELESFPFGRPLRVVRQENRYLGAARNRGAESAQGDLLVFIDDDDSAEPTYVSILVAALLHSGADAVTSGMETFWSEGEGPLHEASANGKWLFLGDAVDLASMFNCLGGAAAIIRKAALLEVGGFHTFVGVGYEDWELYVRMLLAGHRVLAVPEVLYRYRHRAGSMVRSNDLYTNGRILWDTFGAHLPRELQSWPNVLQGLSEELERQAKSAMEARAQVDVILRYVATIEHSRGRDEPLESMIEDLTRFSADDADWAWLRDTGSR